MKYARIHRSSYLPAAFSDVPLKLEREVCHWSFDQTLRTHKAPLSPSQRAFTEALRRLAQFLEENEKRSA